MGRRERNVNCCQSHHYHHHQSSRIKFSTCPGYSNYPHTAYKAQWLLYIPPGLTLQISTSYSHEYFVWIWEQIAIISLHNINWLVCITETGSVYCSVRTGYTVYILHIYMCACVCACVCVYIMLPSYKTQPKCSDPSPCHILLTVHLPFSFFGIHHPRCVCKTDKQERSSL